MNKIGDKLRFKAMGDITDFHSIAEKYLTDLIIKTNGIVTIREITEYGDYRIKECELDYHYEKDMFSGLVEDTTPSTERKVWLEDMNIHSIVDEGRAGMEITDDHELFCPIANRLPSFEDFDELTQNNLCHNDCAAFAIKDGCAICKMMHGDQIIGRLIEKGTE